MALIPSRLLGDLWHGRADLWRVVHGRLECLGLAMKDKESYPNRADLLPCEVIAKELGVSRQSVANIEAKALAKLKRELAKRGYQLEDFFRE